MQTVEAHVGLMKKFLLPFLLLILASLSGWAMSATYYVDPVDGNDSDNGSTGSPWKTIARATFGNANDPNVVGGDTVYLRTGNYAAVTFNYDASSSTSWSDKITYRADTGEEPNIDRFIFGSDGDPYGESYYIELNDLLITPDDDEFGIVIYSSSSIRIMDCNIVGPWNTNYGMDTNDTNGLNALAETGIEIQDGSNDANDGYVQDITIAYCDIHQFIRGIQASCYIGDQNGAWLIQDNNVYYTSNSQVKFEATNKTDSGQIIVQYNNLHDGFEFCQGVDPGDGSPEGTHQSGISVKASNMIIRGNNIHATGTTAGIGLYNSGGGATGYSDLIIENNLVYDIGSPFYNVRLWDISESGSVIFRNNTLIGKIDDNGEDGWYYNVPLHVRPLGRGAGQVPVETSGLEIYNNIVVGAVFFDANSAAPYEPGLSAMSEDYNYFYSMYNNTTWLTSHDNTVVVTTGDFNDIFESGYFVDINDAGELGGPGMHRTDKYSDLALVEGSPAIDFGSQANGSTIDILKYSRGASPDAGAYEYGAGPTPPAASTYILGIYE